MSTATNTQLGNIILAGDLAGDGSAQVGTYPQLSTIPSLVPGHYSIPRLSVDSKGRITSIENGAVDIVELLPNATSSTAGIVKIGDNIHVAGGSLPGFWVINFNGILLLDSSTGLSNQSCASYGFRISVDGGPSQDIKVFGDKCQTIQSLISEINLKLVGAAMSLHSGNIRIVSTSVGNTSRVLLTSIELFACMNGFKSHDGETPGFGSCEIFVKRSSIDDYGVVKIGEGINVDQGTISINTATATELGVVKVPNDSNLQLDILGNLSVPIATTAIPGVVKIGEGLTIGINGILDTSIPTATAAIPGVVKIGDNINVLGGVISIPTATTAIPGVVKIGDGVSISPTGTLSANIASSTTLGMVKGGGFGVTIEADGTLNASAIQDASTSTKGIVKIGDNIDVTGGAISVPLASPTVKGVVKIGDNIDVTGGVISVPLANGATKGIVGTSPSSRVKITNGMIDIVDGSMILLDSVNVFTKAQITAAYDLGSSDTVTPDLTLSNVFNWSPLGSIATIESPTNQVAGGIYTFIIRASITTNRFVFPPAFRFANNTTSIIPNPGTIGMLTCVYDDVNKLFLCTYSGHFMVGNT